MTLLSLVAVALGGALGAVLRAALLACALRQRLRLLSAINASGSALFGAALACLPPSSDALRALVLAGFCGALTTYSTWMVEVVGLWQTRRRRALVELLVQPLLATLAAGVAFAVLSRLG